MIAKKTVPHHGNVRPRTLHESQRRRDLLELLDRLDPTIAKLTQAIEQDVEKCPERCA